MHVPVAGFSSDSIQGFNFSCFGPFENEMKMMTRTTPLIVWSVLALLIAGTGMPSVWADTLALHATDGIIDKSDPQNNTGDLAGDNAVIGENFNELGESRGFVVFDTTGIDNTNIDTATLTLQVLGGQYFFGTGVAELDVTLLTPMAGYTNNSPPLSLYGEAGTLVATVDTSGGAGTYTTVDISAALKALDLSTNKIVVFRLETTADITWPITQNNAIVIFAGGATALEYTLASPAGEGYLDGFSQSIYMGHSFFNPGTKDIEVLAPFYGYSRHTQYKQIAGGTNGDPGSLWRDTGEDELAKAEIKKGTTEILGMTYFDPADGDSDFEDYTQWIDFTLQYNPDTFDTFFIMIPWANYSNNPSYALQRAKQDLANAYAHDVIQQLRDEYPQLTCLALPVGEAMSRLWLLFDQGQLGSEIWGVQLNGNPENSLMIDDRGHAGNIMEDIIGLIWQQTIYPETDIRTVSNPPTYQYNWTYDIRQLAYDIWQDDPYAHRFNPPADPNNLFVEFGASDGGNGAETAPFNTLDAALSAVAQGGQINLGPGSTNETQSVNQLVDLVNSNPGGGSVIIGGPAARGTGQQGSKSGFISRP